MSDDAKHIIDKIKKEGGYIDNIYYPPLEKPLTKKEIEKGMKAIRKFNETKND